MKRSTRVLRCRELDAKAFTRWDNLLADSPVPSAFLSAAYARAADQAFENVHVCIISEGGRDVAFFPFGLGSPRARLLRGASPVGENFSDYVGMIAESGFATTPDELLKACRLNTLLFTHLDETQLAYGLAGVKPAKGLRIRRAPGSSFLTDLAQRDKKFFQDTERRFKKLERDRGPLRFALEDADSTALDWLIDTKIAQYRRTGQTKHPFSRQCERDFLRTLATQNDPLCKPRLTALYCDDKIIAAHFGLQCAGNLAYWFPVYDVDFHSYSPGRLLMWETLKRADELQIECVDRGEGDTQAKRDFANEEHHYLRGYYACKTLPALIDRGLNSLAWRYASMQKAAKES